MYPEASVTLILENLNIIFDTTASYHILMGDFYRFNQNEVESVSTLEKKKKKLRNSLLR